MSTLLDDEGCTAGESLEQLSVTRTELQAMIDAAVKAAQNSSDAQDEEEELQVLDDEVATSEAVSDALAESIHVRLTEMMPQAVWERKKEDHKTVPLNMQWLRSTDVNVELWGSLPLHAKKRDKRLVKIPHIVVIQNYIP